MTETANETADEVDAGAPESRRDRLRRELTEQIVEIGRRQLEEGGVGAVSWRAIAREVGMNPASLYTYVDGVDDLYTRILLQSFQRLGAAVQEAMKDHGRPPRDRLIAGAHGFRSWALAHPREFNLIYTDQIPNYAAPAGGPTVEAELAVEMPFVTATAELLGLADPGQLLTGDGASTNVESGDEGDHGSAGPAQSLFTLRAILHGFTMLEINNHAPYLGNEGEEMITALLRVLDDAAARFGLDSD